MEGGKGRVGHTFGLFGECAASVVVVDRTTSQTKSEDGVLPASRLGRTGAYQSSAGWATGRGDGCAGERSYGGTKHYEVKRVGCELGP
jgi:hypothetical protein